MDSGEKWEENIRSVCEDHLEFSSFYSKYHVGATLQTAAAGGEQG